MGAGSDRDAQFEPGRGTCWLIHQLNILRHTNIYTPAVDPACSFQNTKSSVVKATEWCAELGIAEIRFEIYEHSH